MIIGVVNLGAANSRSVMHALRRAGGDPVTIDRPERLHTVDALVIPGVAHLGFVIDAIDRRALRGPLVAAIRQGMPTLGICAGFQLLFNSSEEAPFQPGLSILDGVVRRVRGVKIPHMGWNRVEALSDDIESGWAYFAHSFAPPADVIDTVAITENGSPFSSVVKRGNVIGVQFHPERSGRYGTYFLKRFVDGVRELQYVS